MSSQEHAEAALIRGQRALLPVKCRNHRHCIIKDTLCLLRHMFQVLSYFLCLLSDCTLPNKAKQFAHVLALCWKEQFSPRAQECLPRCPKKVAQTQIFFPAIYFIFTDFLYYKVETRTAQKSLTTVCYFLIISHPFQLPPVIPSSPDTLCPQAFELLYMALWDALPSLCL